MLRTVAAWVPETYAAFRDYRMGAMTLSAGMLAVVKRRLAGEPGGPGEQRPQQAGMGGAGSRAGLSEVLA